MIALLFHSAGLNDYGSWAQHLSESPAVLRSKLMWLKDNGCRAIHMAEAAASEQQGAKTVWLSFDDGYLDNWVHVIPILQETGMCATVFVAPDFIDPRGLTHPQVDADTWDERRHDAATCCAGFLSWPRNPGKDGRPGFRT